MKNRRPPSSRALLVALVLAFAAAVGCSARVEVQTTAAADDPPVAIQKTSVELDLFTDRQSEPETEPPAATSEKGTVAQESRPALEPAPREAGGVSAVKSVKVVRNVVNVYEGDLHLHNDTHNHFYGSPRKTRESAKVRVEVVQKPKRDKRCEKLMKEHLEKVKRWEAMFR